MKMTLKKLLFIAFIAVFSLCDVYSQNIASRFRNLINDHEYEKAGEIAEQVIAENPKDYNLLVLAGDVYYELEQYTDAYRVYTSAKEKSKDKKVLVKLGRTLIKLNRPNDAINELSKALENDKKNESLILELANAYLSAGKINEAEIQITNARSINSKNPEVFVMLGKLYFEQKIWELARSNYEEAIKLDPQNIEIRQLLAEVYWKLAVAADGSGDVELMNVYLNRSLEECNKALQENDKDAATWKLKAQIHFNANQNLEAAQSYNKFLELRPNNYKERWRLAELLATSGVCDSAYVHLNQIINTDHPDITDSIKVRAELLLASCYYKDKRYNETVRVFKEINKYGDALKTVDGAVGTYMLPVEDLKIYAVATLFAKDTNEAVVLFKELFKLAPDESCNFMYLVANQILKPQKKYAEMIDVLQQKLNTQSCSDNNDAFCYYTMGTGYFELKDTANAIAALQKSLQVKSDFYWSNIYLGDIYYGQKDIKHAEEQFDKVISEALPNKDKYKNELNAAFQKKASIRLDSKKYAELEKVAREWVNNFPENNEYGYLFLAISCQGQQKIDQAKTAYREVLKVNPNNKTAKDNLNSLNR